MTVTNCPGAPGDLARGRTARPRRASESAACNTARSEVFEEDAGDRFTGVGEPGKKINRLSMVPEAPCSMSFWASESPYQGSATWRLVATRAAPASLAIRNPVPETRARMAGRWLG